MFILGPAIMAAWWIGFCFKDAWLPTRLCFYLPPLLVAAAGAIWLAAYRRQSSWLLRAFVAATILAAIGKAALTDFEWHSPPASKPPGAVRLLHWNTSWGSFGSDRIWRIIAADQPDICVFSEPPLADFPWQSQHLYPNGATHTGAGMAIATRYPMQILGSLVIPHVASWHARLTTPSGPLDILAVDFSSSPLMDRHQPLLNVARWIRQHESSIPLIVVGDFNTPRDSIHLAPLRSQMNQAYEQAGHGWPYSWPVPAPMWAIDQMWLSPGLRAVDHGFRYALCSDHLRQMLDFVFEPSPAATQPAGAR